MKTERIYLVLSSDYLGGLLTDLYASSNYKNLREIKKIVHTRPITFECLNQLYYHKSSKSNYNCIIIILQASHMFIPVL